MLDSHFIDAAIPLLQKLDALWDPSSEQTNEQKRTLKIIINIILIIDKVAWGTEEDTNLLKRTDIIETLFSFSQSTNKSISGEALHCLGNFCCGNFERCTFSLSCGLDALLIQLTSQQLKETTETLQSQTVSQESNNSKNALDNEIVFYKSLMFVLHMVTQNFCAYSFSEKIVPYISHRLSLTTTDEEREDALFALSFIAEQKDNMKLFTDNNLLKTIIEHIRFAHLIILNLHIFLF